MNYHIKQSTAQDVTYDGPFPNKKTAQKARSAWIKGCDYLKRRNGWDRVSWNNENGDVISFDHAVYSSVSFEIVRGI